MKQNVVSYARLGSSGKSRKESLGFRQSFLEDRTSELNTEREVTMN